MRGGGKEGRGGEREGEEIGRAGGRDRSERIASVATMRWPS